MGFKPATFKFRVARPQILQTRVINEADKTIAIKLFTAKNHQIAPNFMLVGWEKIEFVI